MDDDAARRRAGSLQALRALTHPVRLRMYGVLAGRPASAASLARLLEVEHASASYHLRVLRDAGLLALVEERAVNGGVERRYRLVEPPTDPVEGERATTADWLALVATTATILQQRAALVSSDPKWFSDVEVWAPSQAVDRARQRMGEAMEELRGAAVQPHAAGARRVSATALLFLLQDVDGDAR